MVGDHILCVFYIALGTADVMTDLMLPFTKQSYICRVDSRSLLHMFYLLMVVKH